MSIEAENKQIIEKGIQDDVAEYRKQREATLKAKLDSLKPVGTPEMQRQAVADAERQLKAEMEKEIKEREKQIREAISKDQAKQEESAKSADKDKPENTADKADRQTDQNAPKSQSREELLRQFGRSANDSQSHNRNLNATDQAVEGIDKKPHEKGGDDINK